jgi:hypothetical protein
MSKIDGEAQPGAFQLAWYSAVIVGLQAETLQVEAAYIRHDGILFVRGRIHNMPPGRTAVGEAITTLGLTRLRRFSASAMDAAVKYARRLHAEMADDAPQVL